MRRILLCMVVPAGLAGLLMAFASQANEPGESDQGEGLSVIRLPDNPEPAAEPREIEELIVTDRRVSGTMQDEPISVIGFSAIELAARGIGDLEGISQHVPGLDFLPGASFTQIRMRGLGTGWDKGFDPSIGVFIDGVYVPRPAFLGFGFLDPGSIEVLRGPQGTLFGREAIAGAILVNSREPNFTPELSAEYVTGVNKELTGSLMGTMPMGQDFSMRLAVSRQQTSQTFYNTTRATDTGGRDNDTARLTLRYTPRSDLDIVVAHTAWRQQLLAGHTQYARATAEQIAEMRTYDPEFETDMSDFRSSQDAPFIGRSRAHKTDLRMRGVWQGYLWTLLGTDITLDTDDDIDSDFGPSPSSQFFADEAFHLNSLEWRISAPRGLLHDAIEFDVGLYAAQSTTDIDFEFILNQTRALFLTPGAVPDPGQGEEDLTEAFEADVFTRIRSSAMFGTLSWAFAPGWSAGLGLRVAQDARWVDYERRLYTAGEPVPGPGFTAVFGATPGEGQRESRDSAITPKLTLSYETLARSSVYLSYALGYKPSGVSATSGNDEELVAKAERSRNFELGGKLGFLDGRLSLNFALFSTDFDDLQQNIYTGNALIVLNVPEARTRGIEADLSWNSNWGGFASANIALTDARFTRFPEGPCPAGQTGTCDLTGGRMQDAPRVQGGITLGYTQPVVRDLAATIRANWRHAGERSHQVDQDPNEFGPAYSMIDLGLSLGPRDARWDFAILGSNLTNEVATQVLFDIIGLPGAYGAVLQPGRSLTARLRMEF